MKRTRTAVTILLPLASFHLATIATLATLIGLDTTVAAHRDTWIPSIGLIKLDIFIILLAAAAIRLRPRPSTDTPGPHRPSRQAGSLNRPGLDVGR